MPLLPGADDGNRRGHLGTAGCNPGAVPSDRDQTSEAHLPGLPGHHGAGAGTTRLVEGGIPTEALVAHVAVSRHADHQPLYGLAQITARQGIIVDRSTLSFWMGYAARRAKPGP
jgi:hypothetical protein